MVVGEAHDVGAGLLGNVLVDREGLLVVDDRAPADDGAVGQGGAGRLQVQCPLDRHGLHTNPELAQVVRELLDADAVGAPAEPDVGRAAGAQHVAAVEGAGRLDVGHPQAEVAHGPLDAGGLTAALRGPGAGDDGEVAVHDDRVLDEDGVGVVVGGLDLDDRPPVVGQGVDVALPLLAGEVEVDGAAVEVGDDALGQARAGAADERDGRRHGIRAAHEAGQSEW